MKNIINVSNIINFSEEDDLESEKLYNSVNNKLIQSSRYQSIKYGYLDKDSYTDRDLGIKYSTVLYPDYDEQKIQREIDRIYRLTNNNHYSHSHYHNHQDNNYHQNKEVLSMDYINSIYPLITLNPAARIIYAEGVFDYSTPIAVQSDQIHQGQGAGTILRSTAGNAVMSIDTTTAIKRERINIENLRFSAINDTNKTSIGVKATGQYVSPNVYETWMVYIQNCYFTGLGYGILGDIAKRLTVDKCVIGSSPNDTNQIHGLDLKDCPDLRVLNSVIRSNKKSNIYMRPGVGGGPTNGGQEIIGNYISCSNQCTGDSTNYTIYADGIFSAGIHYNVIDQNDSGILLNNVSDISLSHNTIASNHVGSHIEINNGTDVTLTGNDIRNPQINAINLNNIQGLSITGNVIRGNYTNQTTKPQSAIVIKNSYDGAVSSNRIGGININTGLFNQDGIHLENSKNLSVNSNSISKCQRYGLFEDSKCSNNIYLGNTLANNGTPTSLSGTERIYDHNTGATTNTNNGTTANTNYTPLIIAGIGLLGLWYLSSSSKNRTSRRSAY